MTDTFTLPENPYVSINNEIVGIKSGKKITNFRFNEL